MSHATSQDTTINCTAVELTTEAHNNQQKMQKKQPLRRYETFCSKINDRQF